MCVWNDCEHTKLVISRLRVQVSSVLTWSTSKANHIVLTIYIVRHGVVGNISACHADTRGSIPRVGDNYNKMLLLLLDTLAELVKAVTC